MQSASLTPHVVSWQLWPVKTGYPPLPTHRVFSFASVSPASIVYLNSWQRGVAPLPTGAILKAYPVNELTSTSIRRES